MLTARPQFVVPPHITRILQYVGLATLLSPVPFFLYFLFFVLGR